MIEQFRLGYANRTLGYRLPSKRTKEGADAVRGRLERLGVLRSSGHEHLAGSLVVPVMSAQRHRHRALRAKDPPRLRAGTPLHLYLPGPHRGVWNEDGLDRWRGDPHRVADRRADVLLCRVPHVTASFGTSGFTADHHRGLRRATR